MTDTTDDPAARRIMNAIGESNRVPILNVAEGDLYALVGGPVAGLFLGGLTGVQQVGLFGGIAGLVLGIAIVVAAPPHRPATAWLADIIRFYLRRQRRTLHVPTQHDGTADANTATQGGLVSYTPFRPDERTQDLTNVERAWPGAAAVERIDGSIVGMVELDPDNMDFAMSDDWAALQETATDYANDALDGPLTLHATTQSFPADQLVDAIDDRLADDTGEETPVVETLLREYRERRPAELADTTQLRYTLAVEVHPVDVYRQSAETDTPLDRLASLPLVGLVVHPFRSHREGLTEAELRARLLERLDERIRTVETELVAPATGWSSRRLSTVELFTLSMEFWNGQDLDPDDAASSVRETAVLGRRSREATDD